jgi:hypothetical protein
VESQNLPVSIRSGGKIFALSDDGYTFAVALVRMHRGIPARRMQLMRVGYPASSDARIEKLPNRSSSHPWDRIGGEDQEGPVQNRQARRTHGGDGRYLGSRLSCVIQTSPWTRQTPPTWPNLKICTRAAWSSERCRQPPPLLTWLRVRVVVRRGQFAWRAMAWF